MRPAADTLCEMTIVPPEPLRMLLVEAEAEEASSAEDDEDEGTAEEDKEEECGAAEGASSAGECEVRREGLEGTDEASGEEEEEETQCQMS